MEASDNASKSGGRDVDDSVDINEGLIPVSSSTVEVGGELSREYDGVWGCGTSCVCHADINERGECKRLTI